MMVGIGECNIGNFVWVLNECILYYIGIVKKQIGLSLPAVILKETLYEIGRIFVKLF